MDKYSNPNCTEDTECWIGINFKRYLASVLNGEEDDDDDMACFMNWT